MGTRTGEQTFLSGADSAIALSAPKPFQEPLFSITIITMKTLVFTRSRQTGQSNVDRLIGELKKLGIQHEQIDVESRDGSARAELYDIVQTPAVITTRDDGQMLYSWQELLPSSSDISHLAYL